MISALEAGRAVAAATELCPHPEARERAVVVVGRYALCQACKRGFERISAQWDARQLGPREVVAQVVEMGYSRRNAASFLLGLVARRLRVRLGFRE
jgi:hypothetical protein